jgi:hypothetical protein
MVATKCASLALVSSLFHRLRTTGCIKFQHGEAKRKKIAAPDRCPKRAGMAQRGKTGPCGRQRDPVAYFPSHHPGSRIAAIRDRKQAPAFVTIPDNTSGISGMTPIE